MLRLKSMAHAVLEEAAYGVDVQNISEGVFGNAAASIAGLVTKVRSTIVRSSITAGNRQPDRLPKVRPAQ
jgi:hypothetical protein